MTNLERLYLELNERQYFSESDNAYSQLLEEHGLDPLEEYDRQNDEIKLLETVYGVCRSLLMNIDLYMKVETEFATTSAAASNLQKRMNALQNEIDRLKAENGTANSIVSYLFYNARKEV